MPKRDGGYKDYNQEECQPSTLVKAYIISGGTIATGKHKSAKEVAEALDLEYTHPSNPRRKVVLLTDYLGRG